MTWVWRGLAAFAALVILIGAGIAAATGPTSIAPRFDAAGGMSSPESGSAEDASAQPLPTGEPMGGESSLPIEPIPFEERPVAVFLGDSITRGATVDTTWGGVTEWSWFYRLLDDTDGVVQYGGMVAENGMTTSWMADQAYNALALGPDLLIVHGGTNDVSGEIDPAYVVSNLQRIKDAADVYGVPMAVCTLPPRADPMADARAIAVSEAIRAWAEQEGVILLDTGAPLRDPLGGWREGYSADGLHPTPAAAVLMARAAAESLRQIPLGV
jgi:lysophospholipase L1-like esterase